MTDYYVEGSGYTAYGPYSLEDARIVARALTHDQDRDNSVHILGTVEETYSSIYSETKPENPTEEERDSVFIPWEQ